MTKYIYVGGRIAGKEKKFGQVYLVEAICNSNGEVLGYMPARHVSRGRTVYDGTFFCNVTKELEELIETVPALSTVKPAFGSTGDLVSLTTTDGETFEL